MEQIKKAVLSTIEELDFDRNFVKVCGEKKYRTYNEFFQHCLCVRDFIVMEHLNGRQLALIMENSLDFMSFYFAVMMTGCTAAAVDPHKGDEEITMILAGLPSAFIIADETAAGRGFGEQVIWGQGEQLGVKRGKYLSVKEEVLSALRQRDFDTDYLLTFTSGTSGTAKGVRHSLGNLFLAAVTFAKEYHMDETCVFAHFMPMTYMAGILNSLIQPFICGSRIVLCGRFNPAASLSFWKIAEREHINSFWLSPMMLTMILKGDRGKTGEEYGSKHSMLFFIGTAALPANVRAEFEERYHVRLYASYGLSEVLFISTELPGESHQNGGVGKVLGGTEVIQGADGELLASVPWMFLGYSNERTDEYFSEHYYKTGDLGEIRQNQLFITGRKKDLIIRGGLNISPALIENVLSEQLGDRELAIFGMLNRYGEEDIACAYTLGAEEDAGEVNRAMAEIVLGRLGQSYKINRFVPLEAIPKNINGKVDRTKLRQLAGEAEAADFFCVRR